MATDVSGQSMTSYRRTPRRGMRVAGSRGGLRVADVVSLIRWACWCLARALSDLWYLNPVSLIQRRWRQLHPPKTRMALSVRPRLIDLATDFFLSDERRKRQLLSWVKSMLAWEGEEDLFDFAASWQDGIVLCALLETLSPGACPRFNLLKPHHRVNNCRLGITLAQKYLQVAQVPLSPEEMAIADEGCEVKICHLVQLLKWKYQKQGSKPTPFSNASVEEPAPCKCYARGTGLRAGIVGRRTKFNILTDTVTRLSLQIEIRGPNNEYNKEKIVSMYASSTSRYGGHVISASASALSEEDGKTKVIEDGAGHSFIRQRSLDEDIGHLVIPFDYQCVGEGRFLVSYIPRSAGAHHITVLQQGAHVQGSPFEVKVSDWVSSWNFVPQPRVVPFDMLQTIQEKPKDSLKPSAAAAPEKIRRKLSHMATVSKQLTLMKRRVLKKVVTRRGEEIICDVTPSPSLSRQSSVDISDMSDDDKRKSSAHSVPQESARSVDKTLSKKSKHTEKRSPSAVKKQPHANQPLIQSENKISPELKPKSVDVEEKRTPVKSATKDKKGERQSSGDFADIVSLAMQSAVSGEKVKGKFGGDSGAAFRNQPVNCPINLLVTQYESDGNSTDVASVGTLSDQHQHQHQQHNSTAIENFSQSETLTVRQDSEKSPMPSPVYNPRALCSKKPPKLLATKSSSSSLCSVDKLPCSDVTVLDSPTEKGEKEADAPDKSSSNSKDEHSLEQSTLKQSMIGVKPLHPAPKFTASNIICTFLDTLSQGKESGKLHKRSLSADDKHVHLGNMARNKANVDSPNVAAVKPGDVSLKSPEVEGEPTISQLRRLKQRTVSLSSQSSSSSYATHSPSRNASPSHSRNVTPPPARNLSPAPSHDDGKDAILPAHAEASDATSDGQDQRESCVNPNSNATPTDHILPFTPCSISTTEREEKEMHGQLPVCILNEPSRCDDNTSLTRSSPYFRLPEGDGLASEESTKVQGPLLPKTENSGEGKSFSYETDKQIEKSLKTLPKDKKEEHISKDINSKDDNNKNRDNIQSDNQSTKDSIKSGGLHPALLHDHLTDEGIGVSSSSTSNTEDHTYQQQMEEESKETDKTDEGIADRSTSKNNKLQFVLVEDKEEQNLLDADLDFDISTSRRGSISFDFSDFKPRHKITWSQHRSFSQERKLRKSLSYPSRSSGVLNGSAKSLLMRKRLELSAQAADYSSTSESGEEAKTRREKFGLDSSSKKGGNNFFGDERTALSNDENSAKSLDINVDTVDMDKKSDSLQRGDGKDIRHSGDEIDEKIYEKQVSPKTTNNCVELTAAQDEKNADIDSTGSHLKRTWGGSGSFGKFRRKGDRDRKYLSIIKNRRKQHPYYFSLGDDPGSDVHSDDIFCRGKTDQLLATGSSSPTSSCASGPQTKSAPITSSSRRGRLAKSKKWNTFDGNSFTSRQASFTASGSFGYDKCMDNGLSSNGTSSFSRDSTGIGKVFWSLGSAQGGTEDLAQLNHIGNVLSRRRASEGIGLKAENHEDEEGDEEDDEVLQIVIESKVLEYSHSPGRKGDDDFGNDDDEESVLPQSLTSGPTGDLSSVTQFESNAPTSVENSPLSHLGPFVIQQLTPGVAAEATSPGIGDRLLFPLSALSPISGLSNRSDNSDWSEDELARPKDERRPGNLLRREEQSQEENVRGDLSPGLVDFSCRSHSPVPQKTAALGMATNASLQAEQTSDAKIPNKRHGTIAAAEQEISSTDNTKLADIVSTTRVTDMSLSQAGDFLENPNSDCGGRLKTDLDKIGQKTEGGWKCFFPKRSMSDSNLAVSSRKIIYDKETASNFLSTVVKSHGLKRHHHGSEDNVTPSVVNVEDLDTTLCSGCHNELQKQDASELPSQRDRSETAFSQTIRDSDQASLVSFLAVPRKAESKAVKSSDYLSAEGLNTARDRQSNVSRKFRRFPVYEIEHDQTPEISQIASSSSSSYQAVKAEQEREHPTCIACTKRQDASKYQNRNFKHENRFPSPDVDFHDKNSFFSSIDMLSPTESLSVAMQSWSSPSLTNTTDRSDATVSSKKIHLSDCPLCEKMNGTRFDKDWYAEKGNSNGYFQEKTLTPTKYRRMRNSSRENHREENVLSNSDELELDNWARRVAEEKIAKGKYRQSAQDVLCFGCLLNARVQTNLADYGGQSSPRPVSQLGDVLLTPTKFRQGKNIFSRNVGYGRMDSTCQTCEAYDNHNARSPPFSLYSCHDNQSPERSPKVHSAVQQNFMGGTQAALTGFGSHNSRNGHFDSRLKGRDISGDRSKRESSQGTCVLCQALSNLSMYQHSVRQSPPPSWNSENHRIFYPSPFDACRCVSKDKTTKLMGVESQSAQLLGSGEQMGNQVNLCRSFSYKAVTKDRQCCGSEHRRSLGNNGPNRAHLNSCEVTHHSENKIYIANPTTPHDNKSQCFLKLQPCNGTQLQSPNAEQLFRTRNEPNSVHHNRHPYIHDQHQLGDQNWQIYDEESLHIAHEIAPQQGHLSGAHHNYPGHGCEHPQDYDEHQALQDWSHLERAQHRQTRVQQSLAAPPSCSENQTLHLQENSIEQKQLHNRIGHQQNQRQTPEKKPRREQEQNQYFQSKQQKMDRKHTETSDANCEEFASGSPKDIEKEHQHKQLQYHQLSMRQTQHQPSLAAEHHQQLSHQNQQIRHLGLQQSGSLYKPQGSLEHHQTQASRQFSYYGQPPHPHSKTNSHHKPQADSNQPHNQNHQQMRHQFNSPDKSTTRQAQILRRESTVDTLDSGITEGSLHTATINAGPTSRMESYMLNQEFGVDISESLENLDLDRPLAIFPF